MKWHWWQNAVDFAKTNQNVVENVNATEFEGLLVLDEAEAELDKLCSDDMPSSTLLPSNVYEQSVSHHFLD